MTNIIEVNQIKTVLSGNVIHEDLNFTVKQGEILAIVGGSGSGKTTILREILALTKPVSGEIKIFGKNILTMSAHELLKIQKRWGVLFQQNALFSSLTLLENVSFPLKEHTKLAAEDIKQLALLKILMAGLQISAANRYPAELSGGMQKRAGLARAIVLDPEILFLDEPTSGLDPDTAAGFYQLVVNLQRTMGLTIVMVTHDLESLWTIADRVAFLGEGKVICIDTMPNMVKNPNPLIQAFFHGPRGRIVEQGYQLESDNNHGN